MRRASISLTSGGHPPHELLAVGILREMCGVLCVWGGNAGNGQGGCNLSEQRWLDIRH